MVLVASPVLNTPSGAVRAASRDPERSKMPSLLAGLAACTLGGFFFLVCGGIAAAILIPDYLQGRTAAKAQGAEASLEELWAAQQSWANAHDGEFLEFYVDSEEPTDPNLERLRVTLDLEHYAYEARYEYDDVFVITASGNLDEDESYDEWELVSDDPTPRHLYDDVTERGNYRDEYVEDGDHEDGHDDDEEGGVVGGVIGGGYGLSGVGQGGSGASAEIDAKASTARENLEAVWKGQQAYKLKKKAFMPFDKGSAATWTALGIDSLPAVENHSIRAAVSGDTLTLTATANLDADAFEDEWRLSSADGIAIQVKNDALNLDLSALSGVLEQLQKEER